MATEDITSLLAERLSFFFSDANLRIDKFLRRLVLDSYSGGYVEIDTLLKFNTIKKISTDPATVAEAAATVPALKLNDTKTAIARVEAFTEDMMNDNIKVTIRVGGLPTIEKDDGSHYVNTRDEVGTLFEEFGKVVLVRLLSSYNRKEEKKIAVGKCFVEFASSDSMEKAVSELCATGDDKPKRVMKIGESELTVKTMQQWLDKRASKRAAEPDRGDRKPEKRNRDDSENKGIKEEETTPDDVEFKLDWKKGCVIEVKGMPEGCDREKILEAVKSLMDDVQARADYSRGDKDGKIRFNEPNEKIAELSSKLNDGSITIGDAKVESAAILEGEAEEAYYKDYIAFRTEQMRQKAKEKNDRNKRRRRR